MRAKIIKRNSVIFNAIFFVLLSPVFLHLVLSLDSGASALSLENFKDFSQSNAFVLGLTLLTSFSLFRFWKFSIALFALCTFSVFALSFVSFIMSFNKLLLFLSILYLLVAYYFYVILKLESREAVYNPGYHYKKIGVKSEHPLAVEVSMLKSNGKVKGYLTNWGESTLFFTTDHGDVLRGPVRLYFEMNGRKFKALGKIVTKYPYGHGVRLKENLSPKEKESLEEEGSTILGWNEYYDIIRKRGFKPRMI